MVGIKNAKRPNEYSLDVIQYQFCFRKKRSFLAPMWHVHACTTFFAVSIAMVFSESLTSFTITHHSNNLSEQKPFRTTTFPYNRISEQMYRFFELFSKKWPFKMFLKEALKHKTNLIKHLLKETNWNASYQERENESFSETLEICKRNLRHSDESEHLRGPRWPIELRKWIKKMNN